MPLINCPDCKNKMSDTATSCPKCGRPNTYVPPIKKSARDFLWIGVLFMPYIFSWFTLRKKYSKFAKFVSFAWLFIFALALFTKGNTNNINNAVRTNSSKKEISAKKVVKSEATTKQNNDYVAMTNHDFAKLCGSQITHEVFEKTCQGKSVMLEGVITEEDSRGKVRIDIGDEAPWRVELDKTTPHYKQGTRVKFSATLDDQMGWGANMKNGHFWAVLSSASTNKKKTIEGSASTGPDTITGKPTKDFTTCLMAQAKNDTSGQLSSFDGGNSAMKMMVECGTSWHAYLDECIQARVIVKSGV